MVMTNFGSWKTPTSRTSWLLRLSTFAALASVTALTVSFEGCTNGTTVTCGADAGCGTGVFFSDAAMTDGGATDTASEGATDAPAGDAPATSDAGTDSGDDAEADAGTDAGTDAGSTDAASSDAPATDAPVDSPTQG